MRTTFLIILIVHGLIHTLGFLSAFNLVSIRQFRQIISKAIGLWWLAVAIVFLITAILFSLHQESWIYIGLIAVIISQALIIFNWQDARAGTFANVTIFLVLAFTYSNRMFEMKFEHDVQDRLSKKAAGRETMLTEKDLMHLPAIVQKYLGNCNSVNKPKVTNVRILFEGEMRAKGKDYFKFTSEQYNFFDEPTRLFFMKAQMFGITVPGYHKYIDGHATMDIRLFGLIPIVSKSGPTLNKTETVTLFNDMCLLAPGSLIDTRIQWKELNDTTCLAIFTNHDITVSATLYFNQQGKLMNFISHDRTEINEMKQYPFSTPVHEYKETNGRHLIYKGDAIWHYPEGDFIYGRFTVRDIEFNIR